MAAIITQPFNIMCFSWNAAGLRLCETMSQNSANSVRQSGFGVFKDTCVAPDFFEDIRDTIRAKRPALTVMVTEDEATKGSYFHSNLLTNAMPEIGYILLHKEKFDNATEGNGSVRISIYTRIELLSQFRSQQRLLTRFFGTGTTVACNQSTRSSGAVAIYIQHEVYGRFAFIATHLPLGTTMVDISPTIDYDSYRAVIRATNTLCLIAIMDKLISSLPVNERPDHILLLGDLNYDISIPGRRTADIITDITANITAQSLRNIRQYDELRRAMEEAPLLGFKEGASGEGPLFLPTSRLVRGRGVSCEINRTTARVDPSCFGNLTEPTAHIGWHDRILYKDTLTSPYIMHCTEYNRIDIKNIHESTHAAVAGLYELRPIK